jgi:hypothetical protein
MVVCDGHGVYGHEVSNLFVEILPLHIENNLPLQLQLSPKTPVPPEEVELIK